MKTVTIFRHAKSGEKDSPTMPDFDRPLAGRGLKAAPKMGAAMRARRLRPDLILCSPSVRTRQTLTLASPEAWDNSPAVRYEDALYEASLDTLLGVLRQLPGDVSHAMIVGHNPGLQELAMALAPKGSEERQAFREKLPTAAVVSFDFDTDQWSKLQVGSGRLSVSLAPDSLELPLFKG
jgi:phosphohistidine phosphatase